MTNKDIFLSVYSCLLKDKDPKLVDEVEEEFSAEEHPWLHIALAAATLFNESKFIVKAKVLFECKYFYLFANSNGSSKLFL